MGKLYDGLGGLTTSIGTGTYTITGPITGYIPFSSITDNDLLDLVVRGPGNFREVGEYRKIGGASAQLQRVQIYATHADLDGGTNVDWPAGEKQIYSALSADSAVSRRLQNIWLDHQMLTGKRLCLSADNNSYIYSSANDMIDFVLGAINIGTLQYISSMVNLTLKSAVGGAATGPILRLERNNATPAPLQNIGGIDFIGRDSGNNTVFYAKDYVGIADPVNGTEDGFRVFTIISGGAQVDAMVITQNAVAFNSNAVAGRYLLINKVSGATGDKGAFFDGDSQFFITTSDLGHTPVTLRRLASGAGWFMSFVNSAGAQVGKIHLGSNNTTVTFGPFIGGHSSSFDNAFSLAIPLESLPLGTVVCSTDAIHSEVQPWLPKWRLPEGRADRCVYGVYGGPQPGDDPELPQDSINSLGQWQVRVVGPVYHGDLLESDGKEIGCASVQDDDVIRSSTIGKCRRTDLATEPRVVPCTLMCG